MFCEKKDELIYCYGIIHCKTVDFEQIDKDDILAYRKKDFEWQVLVSNRDMVAKKYKNCVIDNATVDEIMLLFIRGELK